MGPTLWPQQIYLGEIGTSQLFASKQVTPCTYTEMVLHLLSDKYSSCSIMPPGQPHAVLKLQPSIMSGGHFITPTTLATSMEKSRYIYNFHEFPTTNASHASAMVAIIDR